MNFKHVDSPATTNSNKQECPYSEIFWSVFSRIRTMIYWRDTPDLSVFSPITEMLQRQWISFSTAQTFSFLDKHSFRKLETLMTAFYLKVKRNQLKLFYMAIKTITLALAGLSLFQPSNT